MAERLGDDANIQPEKTHSLLPSGFTSQICKNDALSGSSSGDDLRQLRGRIRILA